MSTGVPHSRTFQVALYEPEEDDGVGSFMKPSTLPQPSNPFRGISHLYTDRPEAKSLKTKVLALGI